MISFVSSRLAGYGDAYVLRVQRATPTATPEFAWAINVGGADSDAGLAIASHADGTPGCLVTGSLENGVTVGGQTYTYSGKRGFVMALSDAGALQWFTHDAAPFQTSNGQQSTPGLSQVRYQTCPPPRLLT